MRGASPTAHAELGWRSGVIMLGSASDGQDGRLAASGGQSILYLAVEDPDEHCRRAAEAGAGIARPLEDADHGSRG